MKKFYSVTALLLFNIACSQSGPTEPGSLLKINNAYVPPPVVAGPRPGPMEGTAVDWRVAPGCGDSIAVPEPTPHALGPAFRVLSPTRIFAIWTLPNYTIHAQLHLNEAVGRWQVCSWDKADF
jgi:hypothetical protein